MRKEKVTVEYPALIQWIRTLDAWSKIANASTQKKANKAIWNDDRYAIADWIELGHGLMTGSQCTMEMGTDLMHFVACGIIDPVLVAEQIKAQDWEYTSVNDFSEKEETEYFPLTDSWCMAIGCAMVLTKTNLPFCSQSREWLAQGMELFYSLHEVVEDEQAGTPLVDQRHEAWLEVLCTQEPWAREVAAQWALDNGACSPLWPWLFDDCLGTRPSCDFVDSVLQTMDSQNDADAFENPQLDLLKDKAPRFFTALTQGVQTYCALYGEVPAEYVEHQDYCLGRAQVVSSMFPDAMASYAGNAELSGVSSTSPSMGRLFCADEPSNAV